MPDPISAAAFLEKNRLAGTGAWIVLLRVTFPDAAQIRLSSDTQDTIWPAVGGDTYISFPFDIGEVGEESKGEVPQAQLKVGNASRAIEAYIQTRDGGVGAQVEIMVVHADHLDLADPEMLLAYEVVAPKADVHWVYWTLGAPNPYKKRFPREVMRKHVCKNKFKDARCGYGGAELACDKTLTMCEQLGNKTRFQGRPGVGSSGVYV